MDIIIIGAGGHAKVVFDIIIATQQFNVISFTSANKSEINKIINGVKIESIENAFKLTKNCIIAVGDNCIRQKVFQEISIYQPSFVTCIHPSATISPFATIKEGTVVMPNVVVNSGANISSHCIINSASVVEHDCSIGKFSSLAPGVIMGGGASLGEFSHLGIGVNLNHLVSVGDHTIVGTGSNIIRNLENNVVAYGTPARKIRSRESSDRYL